MIVFFQHISDQIAPLSCFLNLDDAIYGAHQIPLMMKFCAEQFDLCQMEPEINFYYFWNVIVVVCSI